MKKEEKLKINEGIRRKLDAKGNIEFPKEVMDFLKVSENDGIDFIAIGIDTVLLKKTRRDIKV